MSTLATIPFGKSAEFSPRFAAPGPNVMPVGLIPGTDSTPAIFFADNPESETCAIITYLTYSLIDPHLQRLIRARLDNIVCAYSPLSGGMIMRECMEFSSSGEFLPLDLTPHSAGPQKKDENLGGRAHPDLKAIEIYTETNHIDIQLSHTKTSKERTKRLFGNTDTTELSEKHTPVLDLNHTDSMIYKAFKTSSSMNPTVETAILLRQLLGPKATNIPSNMAHEIGHMITNDITSSLMIPTKHGYKFPLALKAEIDFLKARKYKDLEYFAAPLEAIAELIGNTLLIRIQKEAKKHGINLPELTSTPLHYAMPETFLLINESLDRYCELHNRRMAQNLSGISATTLPVR